MKNIFKRFIGPLGLVAIAHCMPLPALAAENCGSRLNPETETQARTYMKSKGLIEEGSEVHYPELGIETRWELVKVVPTPSGVHCFAVMALCNTSAGIKECSEGPFEVLGLSDRVVPFEKVQPVPNKFVAKIGFKTGSDLSYYYAMLTGKSAIAAAKSLWSDTPYFGFSGIAVLGKKAAFDPTSGRNWRIEQASFDLRRGSTAEVLDVQAFQFDGLDAEGAEGYWGGCQKPENKPGKCQVAPWGQAYIRELKAVQ